MQLSGNSPRSSKMRRKWVLSLMKDGNLVGGGGVRNWSPNWEMHSVGPFYLQYSILMACKLTFQHTVILLPRCGRWTSYSTALTPVCWSSRERKTGPHHGSIGSSSPRTALIRLVFLPMNPLSMNRMWSASSLSRKYTHLWNYCHSRSSVPYTFIDYVTYEGMGLRWGGG